MSGGNLLDAAINRIFLHGFEAGAFDHSDDLVLGHLYFVVGFDRVAMGEFAAVDDVSCYQTPERSSSKPGKTSSPETFNGLSSTSTLLSGR
jgi:hypothetical protein